MNGSEFDPDPIETKEWLDAFYAVMLQHDPLRAGFILKKLFKLGLSHNCGVSAINTPYCNTLSNNMEVNYPGNIELEHKILAAIRWNAIAMVVRANQRDPSLGGHLSTYASSAVLYEVGFNHFWKNDDLIFFQGHASPGIYARAFLENRLTENHLNHFRQEIFDQGLSSYPHPWSMPDFWQFSTVSMGLGPIQAIYQARFMRYLAARQLVDCSTKKVWCFCGDGEMDEPESLGALSLAGREKLANLIFVVNCNLQRLDGPVRGNGKIIQELESIFLGAGWNVLKVIWNHSWEELLNQDRSGALLDLMEHTVDGEYQRFGARDPNYLRTEFFGKNVILKKLISHWSDQALLELEFGGHDLNKVYQAYRVAVKSKHQPTVILVKSVKGYGLGAAGESLNTAHSVKKLKLEDLQAIKARFNLPLSDQELVDLKFLTFAPNSPEAQYLREKRQSLGGFIPTRRVVATQSLAVPALLGEHLNSNNVRVISTTMAFVKILNSLCKDPSIGKRIVPIIADEARTFGMEGFFRQFSIYAPFGQAYQPVDSAQVMFYKEDPAGQVMQEGINEAGAFCSWLAAATSYSNHDYMMIPFYIFYSMFGFQRIGDLIWAAADMRARGFLIGATSGRTSLAGEGLQHGDGHSHVIASTVPNCLSYDPAFSYELAVIIEDGLKKMVELQRDYFYYITVTNENYPQLNLPQHSEVDVIKAGILKGLYLLKPADQAYKLTVQLIGSGAIINEVIAAQEILQQHFNITANIWVATSFNLLAREARILRQHSLFGEDSGDHQVTLNQDPPPQFNQLSHLEFCLANQPGPVIAATDYIKLYAEQIREFIPNRYITLGTDGFGYSDSRSNLRKLFKVSARHIVIATLQALIADQVLSNEVLKQQF